MKMILFCSLLCISIAAASQTYDFNGRKLNAEDICNSLGFQNNSEAISALDKICTAAGLSNNYLLVPCPNLGTCVAIIKDEMPMILYDNAFLKKIKSFGFSEKNIPTNNVTSNVDWQSLTILSHELGHHVNQHFSKLRSGSEYLLKNELEADNFAGKIMHKLGASLEDTKKAFYNLPEISSYSHPGRAERLLAVERGYYSETSKPIAKKITADAIVGNWSADRKINFTIQSLGKMDISIDEQLNKYNWSLISGRLFIRDNFTNEFKLIEIIEVTDLSLSIKFEGAFLSLARINESAKENSYKYLSENFKNLFYTKRGFTSREIGGIFDLKISLVNKSNSEIEYAKVKIDYLKSNLFSSGRSHKTEYITFQKVKPKSTAEMRGPDSDRGVDVNITITELQLKNGIKIIAQE
jgi:hypothetical protein